MWFFIPQFVGFLIFLVASFAETNRAPFDLTEADAELVGGYNTEYGGGRFASYYFAEYLNVLVVACGLSRRSSSAAGCCRSDPSSGLGRPVRGPRQDGNRHLPVHLGQGHARRAFATTS